MRVARRNDRSGAYVWLVGPDGSGKSTLASGLPDDVLIKYWRVGVLPMARQIAGKAPSTEINTDPHSRKPDPAFRAAARLLYYAFDNVLGHLLVVNPARRRGTTVVVDRGWADMVVDPRRYGLRNPRLARLIGQILPRPDAIIVAAVDPATAHSRKPELPVGEIARQYQKWQSLRWSNVPIVTIDNEGSPEASIQALDVLLMELRS